jgi:hypothetical protein
MEIIQWEPSCSVQMDRHDKASAFHNFANAPKNENSLSCSSKPITVHVWDEIVH